MTRRAFRVVAAVVLLLLVTPPVHAHAWGRHFGGRARVIVGAGPFWWGPPYPYWYYPPPYYVYAPPAPPPVVVWEAPPVYVQQQPSTPPAVESYWYYCTSAQAYYPTVAKCPEAWIKVPPRSP